ncbi:MAG: glycosyltransferase family 2 protein [Phycisphaerales bacterium]
MTHAIGSQPAVANSAESPEVSVVAPAHNEEDNVDQLVREIESAMTRASLRFEIVIVDDGSTDSTRSRLLALMASRPYLRVIAMTNTPKGKGNGQSAAFHAGFRACRGEYIAVLDADLQNDPAEIPEMLRIARQTGAGLVQGDRSHARQDNVVRKVGSIVGRKFRLWLLGDTIRDTGCSLRVMRREIGLRLPLEFRGMHRFIPVTARHLGYTVVETPVKHRPRVAGETKYGMGVLQRAIPGLIDLFAVRYMRNRRRPVTSQEVHGEPTPAGSAETRAGASR